MMLWHAFVSTLPFDWAQFAFMHNALLAVLVATPLLALLGCLIVNTQMAFFSETLGHSALTGIAIGAICGVADPVWAMLAFAVLLALSITFLRRASAATLDTLLSIVMSSTLALGIVLLSRGGGFARYSRYLVGDILAVSPGELLRLFAVAGLVLLAFGLDFNRLLLVSINRSLAKSRHIALFRTEAMFAALTAVVVTVSIPWVGILVINALLILPVAAARNLARTVTQYLWLSMGIGWGAGIAGLLCSFYWGTASGATIVLVALVCFVLSVVVRRFR